MCSHIRKADGLGAATEAVLFGQAQAGRQESLNELMARHARLVYAVMRRHGTGTLAFGEALHAGRVGLWRAILGYDPLRGIAFSTYAWPSIMRHIWQAVKASAAEEEPASLDETGSQPVDDGLSGWEQAAVQHALWEAVRGLPPRLRRVVLARYGLAGQAPATYAQIGAALGLTGERVRQLHTEALVWLRQPAHSYHVRSLLERHTLADYQAADELAQAWLRRRGGRHER